MPHFTSHGHRLHYYEQGRGPLLLLLPGNSASGAHMRGELEHFSSRGLRAVALDLLGTGRSERLAVWPDDWWLQGARDAAVLVHHLGEESCVAVGCSGGADVALLMAALAPEKVRAVVADSTAPPNLPAELRAAVAARPPDDSAAAGFWQYGHGDDWRQVVQADSDLLLRLAERGGDILGDCLAKVHCPVLFTASLRDEMLPTWPPGCALWHGRWPAATSTSPIVATTP